MPRSAEYQRLRARGLCVQCWRPSSTAKCPKCKAKERLRAKAARLQQVNAHGYRYYSDGLQQAERQEKHIRQEEAAARERERERRKKFAAAQAVERPDDWTAPKETRTADKAFRKAQRRAGHDPDAQREDAPAYAENQRLHHSRDGAFMAARPEIAEKDHVAAAELDHIKAKYRRAKKAEKERHKGRNIKVRVRKA